MRVITLIVGCLLLINVMACESTEGTQVEHDVAYCVDKDGNILPEEKCENDSSDYDPVLYHWIYFPHTHEPYTIGQRIVVDQGSRSPRTDIPAYKASVVRPNTGMRITPAPAKQPGWGVKVNTPPPKSTVRSVPNSTPRTVPPPRMSTPPPRVSSPARGR